jgi:hypothetical protein
MKVPNLDEATKKGLDEITKEKVISSCEAYDHEILWYGIEAVAHAYLMQMALDISKKLPQDEFVKKYDLNFESQDYGFIVPFEKIESEGIFIPQLARCRWPSERRFHLFSPDYRNRIRSDCWVERDYARQLLDRKWQSSDLEDAELVLQGVKFGRDLWKTCVDGFHKMKKGVLRPAQPLEITNLGEKLIEYYSTIVEPTP